jgi:hypothetical protein
MSAVEAVTGEGAAPWTVLAYVPVSVAWIVVFRLTDGIPLPLVPTILGLLVEFALGYGMYRRHKAAWTIALILMVLPVLGIPNRFVSGGLGSGLLKLAFTVVLLFLLLHRTTRRWCWEVREPMTRP